VAIVNAEERTSGPLLVLAAVGLQDVEDDGDAVLVIAPHQALVSIGCVCSNYSVPLQGMLGLFMIWNYYLGGRLERHLVRVGLMEEFEVFSPLGERASLALLLIITGLLTFLVENIRILGNVAGGVAGEFAQFDILGRRSRRRHTHSLVLWL